jgi:hypothetical protein
VFGEFGVCVYLVGKVVLLCANQFINGSRNAKYEAGKEWTMQKYTHFGVNK